MANVLQVQKTKRGGGRTRTGTKMHDLAKLQGHNRREGDYAKAENIVKGRTKLNYSLGDLDESESYSQRLERILERMKKQNPKMKKPRGAEVASWIVSANQKEMEAMTPERQKEYFQLHLDYLKDVFGEENLVYADVHMDELTPHLHVGFVPTNKDGSAVRWDDKINSMSLKIMHREIPKLLKEAGFEVAEADHGVTNVEKKHMDSDAYRKLNNERIRLKGLNQKLKYKEQSRNARIKARLDAKIESLNNQTDEKFDDLSKRVIADAEAWKKAVEEDVDVKFKAKVKTVEDKETDLDEREKDLKAREEAWVQKELEATLARQESQRLYEAQLKAREDKLKAEEEAAAEKAQKNAANAKIIIEEREKLELDKESFSFEKDDLYWAQRSLAGVMNIAMGRDASDKIGLAMVSERELTLANGSKIDSMEMFAKIINKQRHDSFENDAKATVEYARQTAATRPPRQKLKDDGPEL